MRGLNNKKELDKDKIKIYKLKGSYSKRLNSLCHKHNQRYSFFCEICKINLCDKCKKIHKNHSTRPILEIIPNKEKEISIKNNFKEFNKKIEETESIILGYRNEIDKRFREICGFLLFLKDINRRLLNNFNYNCYDYYNFSNFNYLYFSLKNEEIFDATRYKNYLFNIDHNKIQLEIEIEKEEKSIKVLDKNESDNNYIEYLSKLEYLKNNIFYVFEGTLNFFMFENFSFKPIFNIDLSKFKIKSIEPAKYSDKIFINFASKKNIKILEYDIENKSIYLSKKEIKEQRFRFEYSNHFDKCIDNKNGNILTLDVNGIVVWKNDKKKNYIKDMSINYYKPNLYDINESLFCFQDGDSNIIFYDSENYNQKKTISYNAKVNLIGTINNESIFFMII